MAVLKELKTRIETGSCSKDELVTILEAYPRLLKNKVSQQMASLAIQELAKIEDTES